MSIRIAPVIVGLIALLGVAAGCSAPTGALPSGAVPVGVSAVPITGGTGLITENDAVAVVRQHFGSLVAQAKAVEANLVALTDPSVTKPSAGEAVWVIHLSGVSVPAGGAIGPNHQQAGSASSNVMTNAYIYVDAATGTYLSARFED